MLSNTKAQSSLEPKWALYSFLVCLLFVDQFSQKAAFFSLVERKGFELNEHFRESENR